MSLEDALRESAERARNAQKEVDRLTELRILKKPVDRQEFDVLVMLGRGIYPDARDDEEAAMTALNQLISSCVDGVRRPGAWERGWIESAFGCDWETDENLPGCPDHDWHDLPCDP